jgi:hypothetical protein
MPDDERPTGSVVLAWWLTRILCMRKRDGEEVRVEVVDWLTETDGILHQVMCTVFLRSDG